ncbi:MULTISPECIES: mechanosensitive ion channel family protein [Geobacter]|uniref:Mechanosensitive ion channel protein MscS n=2 Tax=Geobacter TaxID=28231 RepID=A0A0C1QPC3_9BACT|nr:MULTISPECIES: mechanosensitive ion channel family protein [Geobacter]ANA40430.1 mechanosensitive ion channel protein MscS [Geobacter anodireducens]KIE42447.1 mechanosensitive ion channel protein MscS [Geobacter soli]MBE2887165.1 mechanosensitive ion channel family protein [Geobacter anodireducens]HMN03762.1 mechanosensitive ion channel family protein [Geobacter anodireducens]
MDSIGQYQQLVIAYATEIGTKIIAAIIFWIVGRWLIHLVQRMLQQVLEKQKVDPSLMRYLGNFLGVALNIVLVVAILGYFGVQTTTFAALVAGVGIAVGAAWGGLLSNLAAGAFLLVLRPFKVGDFVTIGGITGTVQEIGLFVTAINTPDNVMTMVGNAKIFNDTIQNYTINDYRRVELKCQLAGSADHVAAMELLREKLAAVPNVLSMPAVDVEILDFTLVGPVLAVRPYCHNDHYWQVYFDGNRTIREALAAAGFPAPMPAQVVLVQNPQGG